MRYKSVEVKVKSLELVRRLDIGTRRAYFQVAKTCVSSIYQIPNTEHMAYRL